MLRLLVLNVGSTSLKFKLLEFDEDDLEHPRDAPAQGRLERSAQPGTAAVARSEIAFHQTLC